MMNPSIEKIGQKISKQLKLKKNQVLSEQVVGALIKLAARDEKVAEFLDLQVEYEVDRYQARKKKSLPFGIEQDPEDSRN